MPARMASWFERSAIGVAADADLARVGPGHAEQREGELGAAGAEQAGEAQHLTAPEGEDDVGDIRRRGSARVTSSSGGRRAMSRAATVVLDRQPGHQLGDAAARRPPPAGRCRPCGRRAGR